ncbi:MAG TPA: glycosyltransferase, partial [Ideonella sp.]|nr:glycosyltransferase [Ideonella sp.]
GLREVQLHHLADHAPTLRELLPTLCRQLGVPLRITLHDYHVICPRINLVDATGRYCGEPQPAVCNRCLQADAEGRAAGPIAGWRAAHRQLLEQADEVIVPDRDVSLRLGRYFPALPVQVRPHEPLPVLPAVEAGGRGAVRQVLAIGSLSVIKGYEVLLGLASSPVARAAGLHFTLLGHSPNDRQLREAGVTVLGRYDDEQLEARIAELQPDLILLPSVWPETYSYVLSGAMKSGRRIAVFDLGAPARRLRAAGVDAIIVPVDLAAHPDLLANALIKAA